MKLFLHTMKIKILALGKKNDVFLKNEVDLYLKRIVNYTDCELQVIEYKSKSKTLPIAQTRTEETLFMLSHLPAMPHHLVVLDERGKGYTSIAFANYIQQKMNASCRQLIFAIGGSYGWDQQHLKNTEAIKIADFVLPHQLVRLVLMEQIYRACTIIKNENYHH